MISSTVLTKTNDNRKINKIKQNKTYYHIKKQSNIKNNTNYTELTFPFSFVIPICL